MVWCRMVCQRVAPRAMEASLRDWGTASSASRVATMVTGRTIRPKVRPAAIRLSPNSK